MDSTIKIFSGRLVMTVMDDFHEVELFIYGKKLKKGYGYIRGDYVYIYRGKKEKFKKSEMIPGIYQDKHGEYIFVEPSTKQEKEMYDIENVIEMDVESIFKQISEKKDDFIDPEDIEIINNNSAAFKPTIHPKDDFLKVAIKRTILDKKTNLKNYKGKFTNQYALNNMKSALSKDTKMTVSNFDLWREILGFKWKLIIEDDGSDRLNPLPEPIVITSEDL